MTLCLYTGIPGSGKSAHAAHDIRLSLNRGRPVIGNFELADDAPVKQRQTFRYVPNEQLTPQSLIDYADEYFSSHRFRENWVLAVIDEAQCIWNARTWQGRRKYDKDGNALPDRMDWVTFFSQHRKYGIKVIMIAQSAGMIDKQFRDMVDTEVNHRKVSTMGFAGWLLSLPFLGRLFLRVTYLYQANERLGSSWHLLSTKDCRMYDSYKRFEQKAM